MNKICAVCKREIKPSDDYCRITDYQRGLFFLENFYHTLCYNNQLRGLNPDQTKMKKMAIGMLAKANKMINKLQGEPEEVYEFK